MRAHLGAPASFVAPAWGYSAGALAAAAERALPTWLPPEPAALLEGCRLRETVHDGLPGLFRLDYGPLRVLSVCGLPPTVVLHGGLVDDRLEALRSPRDLPALARLALRRDLQRLPRLRGIRWVGAAELVKRLRAHAAIEWRGNELAMPAGAEAVLVTASGRRKVRGTGTSHAIG